MAFVSVNTRFKPLSLEEYLKPAMLHEQAYERYAQGLETLATETNQYSQYIPKDSQAYATQQQYLKQLQDVSDTLYREGMNINNNYNNVRTLRKQYTDSILPINNAAQLYAKQAEEKQKLRGQGFVFYNEPSFDQFVQDPSLTSDMYNSDKLYTMANNMAKAISSRTPLKEQIQHLDKYNKIYRGGTGLTEDHVRLMLSNPEFQKSLDSLLVQSGVDKTKMTEEQYQQAMNTALNGAYSGFVYNPKEHMLKNEEAVANLNLRNNLALAKAKGEISANNKKGASTNNGIANRITFTQNIQDNKNKTHQTTALKPNETVNERITNLLVATRTNDPDIKSKYVRVDANHKDMTWRNGIRDRKGYDNFDTDNPIIKLEFDPYINNGNGAFVITTSDNLQFRITNNNVFGEDLNTKINEYISVINTCRNEIAKTPVNLTDTIKKYDTLIQMNIDNMLGEIVNYAGVDIPKAVGLTSEKADNVNYK